MKLSSQFLVHSSRDLRTPIKFREEIELGTVNYELRTVNY
jgi:hypothetical protein